jgi:hypothetical protein
MNPRQEPKPGPDGTRRQGARLLAVFVFQDGKAGRGRPVAWAADGPRLGFAEDGPADVMDPGAELAGLVTAVTGPDGKLLGTLTEQEILGVLGAVQ